MTKTMRYSICKGGADEPGLILIVDDEQGLVVARSSEIALKHVEELVGLANDATSEPDANSTLLERQFSADNPKTQIAQGALRKTGEMP